MKLDKTTEFGVYLIGVLLLAMFGNTGMLIALKFFGDNPQIVKDALCGVVILFLLGIIVIDVTIKQVNSGKFDDWTKGE